MGIAALPLPVRRHRHRRAQGRAPNSPLNICAVLVLMMPCSSSSIRRSPPGLPSASARLPRRRRAAGRRSPRGATRSSWRRPARARRSPRSWPGSTRLVRRAVGGELDDVTRIVYVSPLKALGADVERNLEAPLRGIEATAMRLGTLVPPIRTALRTGDTSQTDRARIVRRPPHVLITTPESLYLLLTSDKGRGVLCGAETVIVDEIHALVGNKRGAHLALSLERLDALCAAQPGARAGASRRASACRRRCTRSTRSPASSSAPTPVARRGGRALVASSTPDASSRSTLPSRCRRSRSPRWPRARRGRTSTSAWARSSRSTRRR